MYPINQLEQEAEKLMINIQQAVQNNTAAIKKILFGIYHPQQIRELVRDKKAKKEWEDLEHEKIKINLNN